MDYTLLIAPAAGRADGLRSDREYGADARNRSPGFGGGNGSQYEGKYEGQYRYGHKSGCMVWRYLCGL